MGDEELENASLLWVKPYTKTFLWFLARCAYAVDIVPVIFVSLFLKKNESRAEEKKTKYGEAAGARAWQHHITDRVGCFRFSRPPWTLGHALPNWEDYSESPLPASPRFQVPG